MQASESIPKKHFPQISRALHENSKLIFMLFESDADQLAPRTYSRL